VGRRPVFPNDDNAGDSFAVLLTNGDVLVEGDSGTSYVFNGTTLTTGPATLGSLMLLRPVRCWSEAASSRRFTTPPETYQAAWAPTFRPTRPR